MFELVNYLPDAIVPQYEDFRDTVLGWLENLGIVRGSATGVSAGPSSLSSLDHT